MMHLLRIRMCCLLIVIWKANWTCALCKYWWPAKATTRVLHMLILHRHIYSSCLAPQHTMSVAGTLPLDSLAPDHSNPAPVYLCRSVLVFHAVALKAHTAPRIAWGLGLIASGTSESERRTRTLRSRSSASHYRRCRCRRLRMRSAGPFGR